jgi:hypothetical protein
MNRSLLAPSRAALVLAAALAATSTAARCAVDDFTNVGGMWLDTDRAAQGVMLEQIDDPLAGAPDGGKARVGVSWYTWAPAFDPQPGARWLFGIGRRDGDTIAIDSIQIAKSGSFPSLPVVAASIERWGRATLVFERDTAGATPTATLSFEGPPAWGSGERRLRLITPSGHGIDYGLQFSPPLAPFMPIGTYSHPPYVGQGWVLNQYARSTPAFRVETTLLWYSYDAHGRPMWMFGIDADLSDGVKFQMQQAVDGGSFEGGTPRLEPWGEVEVWGNGPPPALSSSCIAYWAFWESTRAGYGEGSVSMRRVTRPFEPYVGGDLCFSMAVYPP